MITVDRLRTEDRAAWGRLAAGYKAFYNTPTTITSYNNPTVPGNGTVEQSPMLVETSPVVGFGPSA